MKTDYGWQNDGELVQTLVVFQACQAGIEISMAHLCMLGDRLLVEFNIVRSSIFCISVWSMYLVSSFESAHQYPFNRERGHSVRCIKDSE